MGTRTRLNVTLQYIAHLLYFELFQISLNRAHKLRRSHITVEVKRATSLDNINNINNILSAFKSMVVAQLRWLQDLNQTERKQAEGCKM